VTDESTSRAYLLRLTPDRALDTLDEAEAFLRERGLLTLTPSCSLPSLFGACHEPPYKEGSRGFGSWPRTRWPWGFELRQRPGVLWTKLLRGQGLFLSAQTAGLADPLCRAELARAEAGDHGDEARRLVEHLRHGPALLEDLRDELGLDVRRPRRRLERVGAIVSRDVFAEGHTNTSELVRWDHAHPSAGAGSLDDLVVAAVRAAVEAPEREVRSWFPWRPDLDALVEEGRLRREGALLATS
jgi:hypothetical protein